MADTSTGENDVATAHKAWLEAFTKTQATESTATEKERGTKRAHDDMAHELPTKPDNEETQLRAENEESSEKDDGSKAAAASAQEEPYWIPPPQPQANETEEMRADRIWPIRNYPFGVWRDSSRYYKSKTSP
jgi:hypothetical protein